MSKSRKTIDVADMAESLQTAISHLISRLNKVEADWLRLGLAGGLDEMYRLRGELSGLCYAMDRLLMDTDNYKGFTWVSDDKRGPRCDSNGADYFKRLYFIGHLTPKNKAGNI